MDRNVELQNALEKLKRVINEAVEQSDSVREAVKGVQELGFEPNLSIRLEIALENSFRPPEDQVEAPVLELTSEDIKALRRMRIAF